MVTWRTALMWWALLTAGLSVSLWAQNAVRPNTQRLLVGVSVGDKALGVRHVSLDGSDNIMLSRSVFKALCNLSPDDLCPQLNKGEWTSISDLKALGIGVHYDPTLLQVRLQLPAPWMERVMGHNKRAVDFKHYTYSRNYLEFVHSQQYQNTSYGHLVRQLLTLATPEQIQQFSDHRWFFVDSIIEGESNLAQYEAPASSTATPSSGAATPAPSAARPAPSQTVTPVTPRASAADTVELVPSDSASVEEYGSQMVAAEYFRNNSYDERILQELKGMHQLLQRMSAQEYRNYIYGYNPVDSVEAPKEVGADSVAKVKATRDSVAELEAIREQYEQARAMTKDDFFEQAFGRKPTPKPSQIAVKLWVDDKYFETVQIHFAAERDHFDFNAPNMFKYMRETLESPYWDTLFPDTITVFSSVRLTAAHIDYKLDESRFELRVNIPGEIKQLQVHDFAHRDNYGRLPVLAPARISSYLNLTAVQELSYRELFFKNDSLEQLYRAVFNEAGVHRYDNKVYTEFVFNAHGWVFETQVDFIGRLEELSAYNKYQFTRRYARLVKDFEPQDTRFIAGDVNFNTSILKMTSPQGLGFSGARTLGQMQEYGRSFAHNAAPVEVVLDAPGKVEVYVNEKLVRTEKLSAGRHIFKNIQGSIGDNELRLVIHYDDGRIQEHNSNFLRGSNNNLAVGSYEYQVAGGFAQGRSRHPLDYRAAGDSLMGTGLGRYGINAFLTGEVYGVLSGESQVAGAGLLWQQDSISQYIFRAIASHNSVLGGGARLELVRRWRMQQSSFTLSGAWNTSKYPLRVLGNDRINLDKYQISASAGTSIWRGVFNTSVGANIQRVDTLRQNVPVEYLGSLDYSLSMLQGLSAGVGASMRVNNNQYYPQIYASVSYFFNSGQHSFFAMDQISRDRIYQPPTIEQVRILDERGLYVDSLVYQEGYWADEWRNNLNGGWSWSKASGLNDGRQYSVAGGWQHAGTSVRANAFHTQNWGQMLFNYSLSDNMQASLQSRSHYGVGRFETSVSFADGLWAVGRPIRNNFVLVKGREDLAQTAVRINPDANHNTEYARSWGPLAGVYGDIPTYRTSALKINLVNPELGTWLDDDTYVVRGKYKQGYALPVGKIPKILVRGRLLDEAGEPLARVAFSVVKKSAPEQVVVESFTSMNGVYQVGEVEPGVEYLIVFSSDVFIENATFQTKASARGVVDLADIVVKHQALGANLGI